MKKTLRRRPTLCLSHSIPMARTMFLSSSLLSTTIATYAVLGKKKKKQFVSVTVNKKTLPARATDLSATISSLESKTFIRVFSGGSP